MEAAVWVRPQTIEAIFREERGRWRENRKNRLMGEKNLKLFRFVTERSDPAGKLKGTGKSYKQTAKKLLADLESLKYEELPQGKELVKEWNEMKWVKENPGWAYKPENARILLRDYRRARRTVAYTPYSSFFNT